MIRLGKNGLVAVSLFFVALSGYTATEVIEQSAPPVTPPSPYASQEPADCSRPELEPVRCPNSVGDGCPDAEPSPSGSATSAWLSRPGGGSESHMIPAPGSTVAGDNAITPEAVPAPTGSYPDATDEVRDVVCVEATYPD
ncbi:hypothetical protein HW130_10350 [Streptomyces sp. PKU-EA00015]|uniref:hypothetical protein n=1 Tax=Streptomyces sp. PKU-EA00015 TaxID=2748326 RepID=UPI0015A4CF97|nr:hypothetical protein [Streptomyces sp. PKU-EA00015]NWF26672.1 hypothetical protein [Streptomyces sp. PKU-EA00015]